MNKLQSIISANALDFINNHHLSFQQVKAINAISSCQTANMGAHRLTCECGHEKVVHNSCYNRHCPTCGGFKKEVWVQKQQKSLLPTHYFHVVFTIPDTLRSLIYYNQQTLYDRMYQAASKTVLDLSKDKLGVTPGFSLILHTWSQTLIYHPHLHCILAGGGLSQDKSHFKSFKRKFFIHVKVLSAVYKGKFLEQLKLLYKDGLLDFPNDLNALKNPEVFQSYLDVLYEKDWIVYSKSVFKCADYVIKYLGRYTHRIAIYANRIIQVSDETVSFSYRDRNDGDRKKVMTLGTDEFMRRFLIHVLPHKFVKIRHYGFLSNRFRSDKVALIRKIIARQRGVVLTVVKSLDKLELLLKLVGKERLCCPKCGNFFTYNHEVCLN